MARKLAFDGCRRDGSYVASLSVTGHNCCCDNSESLTVCVGTLETSNNARKHLCFQCFDAVGWASRRASVKMFVL